MVVIVIIIIVIIIIIIIIMALVAILARTSGPMGGLCAGAESTSRMPSRASTCRTSPRRRSRTPQAPWQQTVPPWLLDHWENERYLVTRWRAVPKSVFRERATQRGPVAMSDQEAGNIQEKKGEPRALRQPSQERSDSQGWLSKTSSQAKAMEKIFDEQLVEQWPAVLPALASDLRSATKQT